MIDNTIKTNNRIGRNEIKRDGIVDNIIARAK